MTAILIEITAILHSAGVSNVALEAERIVAAARALSATDYAHIAQYMAKRRAAGTPLAYIVGHELFLGLELIVNEGALIPREETELLGKTALDALRTLSLAHPTLPHPRAIDVCCGSGNLGCALAHYVPTARIWASDLTDTCVSLTRRNVDHVGVADRVVVVQGDLFAGFSGLQLEGTIDVIVCNPPYISQAKLATERSQLLEHEPREAFDGGPYGLSIQQRVVKDALALLRTGGVLLFEIGLGQERQVKMLFERTRAYEDICLVANSQGQTRVVSGRKCGPPIAPSEPGFL